MLNKLRVKNNLLTGDNMKILNISVLSVFLVVAPLTFTGGDLPARALAIMLMAFQAAEKTEQPMPVSDALLVSLLADLGIHVVQTGLSILSSTNNPETNTDAVANNALSYSAEEPENVLPDLSISNNQVASGPEFVPIHANHVLTDDALEHIQPEQNIALARWKDKIAANKKQKTTTDKAKRAAVVEQYTAQQSARGRLQQPYQVMLTLNAQSQLIMLQNDPQMIPVFNAVNKIIEFLSINPNHVSLHTQKYHTARGANNETVFESYVQQSTPGAYRIFWHYGPQPSTISVISIIKHP